MTLTQLTVVVVIASPMAVCGGAVAVYFGEWRSGTGGNPKHTNTFCDNPQYTLEADAQTRLTATVMQKVSVSCSE